MFLYMKFEKVIEGFFFKFYKEFVKKISWFKKNNIELSYPMTTLTYFFMDNFCPSSIYSTLWGYITIPLRTRQKTKKIRNEGKKFTFEWCYVIVIILHKISYLIWNTFLDIKYISNIYFMAIWIAILFVLAKLFLFISFTISTLFYKIIIHFD